MDLMFFMSTEAVQTLSIVKNQGGVEILTKLSGYDSVKAYAELVRAFQSAKITDAVAKKDKAVKTWLNKMEKVGMIDWKISP